MQSVSSRIWTRVAVSISYDDNDYSTGTLQTYKGWYAIKQRNQTKPNVLHSRFIWVLSGLYGLGSLRKKTVLFVEYFLNYSNDLFMS